MLCVGGGRGHIRYKYLFVYVRCGFRLRVSITSMLLQDQIYCIPLNAAVAMQNSEIKIQTTVFVLKVTA